jgi:hypothetical protein
VANEPALEGVQSLSSAFKPSTDNRRVPASAF